MTINKNLYIALEAVDETITKLLALRDVLTVHKLSNETIIEILSSYVDEFSEKHRAVYEEIRKLYNSKGPSLDGILTQAIKELEIEND